MVVSHQVLGIQPRSSGNSTMLLTCESSLQPLGVILTILALSPHPTNRDPRLKQRSVFPKVEPSHILGTKSGSAPRTLRLKSRIPLNLVSSETLGAAAASGAPGDVGEFQGLGAGYMTVAECLLTRCKPWLWCSAWQNNKTMMKVVMVTTMMINNK